MYLPTNDGLRPLAPNAPSSVPSGAGDHLLAGLFRQYRTTIFRSCLDQLGHPWDAEDATMDVFEILCRQLRRQRIDYLDAWLTAVSRNHCRRLKARESRRRRPLTGQALLFSRHQSGPYHSPTLEPRLEELERALHRLNRRQRDCLRCFYYRNLSYRETAEALGLSLKAVKSHIQNGKRNLRRLMREGVD